MNDLSKILERIITAPKKTRLAALVAAETALNGDQDVLVVTQAQAARMLSCSRFTIRRLVMDDALHPVKIRGLLRYRCSELRALAGGKEGEGNG
jgi:hypothetical protein